MKSWLKWGVIFLSINVVLILISTVMGGGISSEMGTSLNPISLLYLPAFMITDLLYWGGNSPLAVFIFSSVFYFLLGAIIGWIIGKIKSPKVISS